MNIIINGIETELDNSLFSYGEMIKKRDQINYIQLDFSAISQLRGEKTILEKSFKDTKKELIEQYG